MDPVPALGVARGMGVLGDHLLTRLQERLQGVSGMTAAPVVHSVEITVLENDSRASTGHSLPGPVEDHHLSGAPRGVELEFQTLKRVDEEVVDKELQPGVQIPDLGGGLRFVLPPFEGRERDQDQDQQRVRESSSQGCFSPEGSPSPAWRYSSKRARTGPPGWFS